MKNILVVYHSIVIDKDNFIIKGGAEVYAWDLCKLLVDKGCNVSLLQFGKNKNHLIFDEVHIFTMRWRGHLISRRPTSPINKFLKNNNLKIDCIIFCSETATVPILGYQTILVQHGIGFDYRAQGKSSKLIGLFGRGKIGQMAQRFEALKAAKLVDKIVAVDYVYPTWLMTFYPEWKNKVITIPNFTYQLEIKPIERNKFTRIIFARRLVERRGVRIFSEAIDLLMNSQDEFNFEFGIAGEGEYLNQLEEKYKEIPEVKIFKYDQKDSLTIHSKYDIAVVPSLASEGTSLSLLQAMAAQCVVITTGVGGTSNIIIDNYNGIICAPTAIALAQAIKKLASNKDDSKRMARAGFETIKYGFSYSQWSQRWIHALNINQGLKSDI